ncbi:MAG: cobalamin-dependent protein [Planctomycetota bacterium]|jgi:5-methyltetrahydrofolate--homocysteine methyltransferase
MIKQELIEKIACNVIQGRPNDKYPGANCKLKGQPGVIELMGKALDRNIDPKEIIAEALAKPMQEALKKFESDEFLAPNVLSSANCVGVAMDMLEPYLKETGINRRSKFVIATVRGDSHDIGPKVVEVMLKGFGYKTINLGIDVSANRILETAINHKVTCVGLSALYTPTIGEMEHTINALEMAGIRDELKVLIGGGATSALFAEQIGADAYCKDAFQAVGVLKRMDNWSGFAGAALN